MKAKERKLARKLRNFGYSVGAIAKRIKCAKGSVSKWVRDIPLTPDQIKRLESNQERGRAKAATHPNSPRQAWARIRNEITKSASSEISCVCPNEMLFEVEVRIAGEPLGKGNGSNKKEAEQEAARQALIALGELGGHIHGSPESTKG